MIRIHRQFWFALAGVAVLLGAYYFTRHNDTPSMTPFTMRISGTPGVQFKGTYNLVNARGNSTSHTISGTVPKTYTIGPGTLMLSVAIHKMGRAGTLRLDVSQGPRHVVGHQTSSPYGGLTVAARIVAVHPGYYRSRATF